MISLSLVSSSNTLKCHTYLGSDFHGARWHAVIGIVSSWREDSDRLLCCGVMARWRGEGEGILEWRGSVLRYALE